jgi:VanZ family protein
MKKKKQIYLILPLIAVAFIWCNSMMPAPISHAISSQIKAIINLMLGNFGSGEAITGDGGLRKVAHAAEYAVLGAILSLVHRKNLKVSLAKVALCGLLIALIDETIQIFSAGRSSEIRDVWIDFGGVVAGMLSVWCALAAVAKRRQVNDK